MELSEYLHGLRRHWAAIILLAALGVGAAWAWTLTQPRVYEASASAYISLTEDSESVIPGQGNAVARSYVSSFMDLATWRSVAEHAITELSLQTTPEDLVNQVTITNPPDTPVLKVQARASSPAAAEALAGAWVQGLQTTIDDVDGTGRPGSAAVNVFLGDAAALPQAPISPDVRMALTIGGVVGLGFGIAFALIRTASDRRIRPGDDVDQKLGVSVVGTIPLISDRDRTSSEGAAGRDAKFAYAEALRTLRTNLQFIDVDNPPRTIVITSPLPGDGKSRTACELAKTLAATGAPVILVDGDLRRSTVAKNMGLPGGAGLSDVLAGRVHVGDVLQQAADAPNLLVLTAGSTPPNPSEVLGSARMRALLAELAADGTVIIDAPPLLSVTDGAILAHQADGALLVTRAGKTTYELAEKALETLEKARGRTLGIVLNQVPLRGVDSSPYAYAYRKNYLPNADHAESTPPQIEQPTADNSGERSEPKIGARSRSAKGPAPVAAELAGADAKADMSSQLLGPLIEEQKTQRARKSRDGIRRT